MANINKKAALVGVGIVAAAGIAGSAFAASITTTNGNAGQGSTVTAGYTITSGISYLGGWTNTAASASSGAVTGFTFLIKKAADGTAASSVTNANTTIYAQLVATTNGNWTLCSVVTTPAAGTASCAPTGSQRKDLSLVTGVNVVAYDK